MPKAKIVEVEIEQPVVLEDVSYERLDKECDVVLEKIKARKKKSAKKKAKQSSSIVDEK